MAVGASRLNCGTCREYGEDRTSAIAGVLAPRRNAWKRFHLWVESPMVNTSMARCAVTPGAPRDLESDQRNATCLRMRPAGR